MFEHALIERARADRRHIVLPEGNDDRILRRPTSSFAAACGPDRARAERDVRARAAALGLTLPGVRIVDPLTSP